MWNEPAGQACAACKYRRRKCSKGCIFAPYFPADQPETFRNAHRLFGLSNIKRILMGVKNDEKEDAMRSIIYESNVRARFPVHGCWGITCQLHFQIQQAIKELVCVKKQLSICKKQSDNGFAQNGNQWQWCDGK